MLVSILRTGYLSDRTHGWTVTAEPTSRLTSALITAVRVGDDTDTVAAVTGGLVGGRWGAAAVPYRTGRDGWCTAGLGCGQPT